MAPLTLRCVDVHGRVNEFDQGPQLRRVTQLQVVKKRRPIALLPLVAVLGYGRTIVRCWGGMRWCEFIEHRF